MRHLITPLLALTLLLTACFPPFFDPSDPTDPLDPVTPEPPPPVIGDHEINGDWIGALLSEANFFIMLTMELVEVEGEVTGFAVFIGEPVETIGDVTGFAHENVMLDITVTDDEEVLVFKLEGQVEDGRFTGEVEDLLGTPGSFTFWRPQE